MSITVELERLVPTKTTMIPFLWAWGDDVAEYQKRLTDTEGIGVVERLFRTDSGTLLRIEWTKGVSEVARGLFELDFTLLKGVGTVDAWRFEVRFPSNESAAKFQDYVREHSIPHEFERVRPIAAIESPASYGLTQEQREALTVAYQAGYFEEPRGSTLSEVADRLDISPSAASGRLRRGHATLLEHTLL